MKHNINITVILISMFIITQIIGLFVISVYENQSLDLPFGMEPPSEIKSDNQGVGFLSQILISFVFAILLFFILTKIKAEKFIRVWFFFVVTIALGLTINAILYFSNPNNALIFEYSMFSFVIALPLSYFKVYKRNLKVHNITELFIYPGIAAVFVAILHPLSVMVLLVLISFYDMWAVWKAKFMQKMAKFEMEELNIFGGFLIPTISKKVREQIQKIKQKYKGKKMPANIKKKKFKVRLAMLGGGDVIFPIITAGVFMRAYTEQALFGIGGLIPALFIILGALAGLTYLMLITEKDKAYPAMPYISTGIFAALILWKFIIL